MKKIKILLPFLIVFSLIAVMVLSGCPAPPTEEVIEETTPTPEEEAEEEVEEVAEEEKEPITIGLLSLSMSIVWEQDVEDVLMALAEQDNATIITMDANFDPGTMMEQLDQLIGMDIDGVVVFIADPLISESVANLCYDNDVAVLFESIRMIDEEGKLVAPGVELDGYGQGVLCGEWIGQYFKDNNITAPYEGIGFIDLDNPDSWNINQRAIGVEDSFYEMISDFPKDQFFRAEMPMGKSAAEGGYDTAMATITANPELTTWFVTGPNDDQGGGAARALEQAGLDENSVVVSMGAESARDEWKKEEDTCWKAATFFKAEDCIGLVWEGMMQLVRGGVAEDELWPDFIAEGETYALKLFTGTMVDKSNFREIMGKYAGE